MSGGAPSLTPARRLAANFCLLSGGEFLAKLLTFAAFAYLARSLGTGQYGTLEFVLAVMVFFTLPADLGLGAYGAREIARNTRKAADLFHEITQMRLFLAILSLGLLLVFTALIQKPPEVKLLLTLYGCSLLLGPALLQWVFQAHDLMHWVALASIIRQGVFAGALFLWFRPGAHIALIGVIEIISVAAVALYCVYVIRFRLGLRLPRPVLHPGRLLGHFRQGLPIGLTELAWAFMWYFATVVLGLVFNDESLGWFGASHRVLMALHTFVWLYFFNLLPSISRSALLPGSHLLALLGTSMRFVAWISIFGAFVMTVFAREALIIAYGPSFAGATRCLAVLMWILPVAMMSGHYRYTLVAYNLQSQLLWCTAVSAGVAVVSGLVLVPFFGATGAALALFLANLCIFALVHRSVRRLIMDVPFVEYVIHPALALSFATAVFFSLSSFNVWAAGAAGAAGYLCVLVASQRSHFLSFVRLVSARRIGRTEPPAPVAVKMPPPRSVRHLPSA